MSKAGEGSKAGRNEQRKLRATSLNVVALAVFAVGMIQPGFAGSFKVYVLAKMALASLVGYLLHELAVRLLKGMED